jgi:hypothetical protein
MSAPPVSDPCIGAVGRIVRYVLPEGRSEGAVRPAIITNVFPTGVNLHVFLDGVNDRGQNDHAYTVSHSDGREPGTWHWPERA